MLRFDIINNLIKKNRYTSYLEIGVNNFDCFKKVDCESKECVDPYVYEATYKLSSDDFFEQNDKKYDIVFIDGLHTEKQFLKDVENSLEVLNDNGVIVCHDCLPENEFQQRDIEKYDNKGDWWGTVWKGFARLRITRPDLYMCVINTDSGCGIIKNGKQEVYDAYEELENLTYSFYAKNKMALMNVTNEVGFDFKNKEIK